MRAVVTGATGFAGSHLAEHLLDQGDAVLGVSQHGRWHEAVPHNLPARVPLVTADLALADSADLDGPLGRALREFAPDCVFHLAALSLPVQCGSDQPTPEAVAANVDATGHIVELASRLPRRPRLLLVSTSHVYGKRGQADRRTREDAPLAPANGYGRSKLLAEQRAQQLAAALQMELIVVRAFQHTGPRQRPPLMLAEWVAQFAQRDASPVVLRNRDTWIDLTDVRDVVRAYRLVAVRGAAGEVYNVGSGVGRRTGEVFDLLHQLADPARRVVELSPGVHFSPLADTAKLTGATGWRPTIALPQTVADTWRVAMCGAKPNET